MMTPNSYFPNISPYSLPFQSQAQMLPYQHQFITPTTPNKQESSHHAKKHKHHNKSQKDIKDKKTKKKKGKKGKKDQNPQYITKTLDHQAGHDFEGIFNFFNRQI